MALSFLECERRLVSRDSYGGEGAFDVETRHRLEPFDVAGHEGEPQRILSARGEGPVVDPCPGSGFVVTWFRAGNGDVSRSWVVLYDETGRPRVGYAARQV